MRNDAPIRRDTDGKILCDKDGCGERAAMVVGANYIGRIVHHYACAGHVEAFVSDVHKTRPRAVSVWGVG